MLPNHRKMIHGRTFSEAWDAARYGSAIECGRRPLLWRLMRFVRFMLRRFG